MLFLHDLDGRGQAQEGEDRESRGRGHDEIGVAGPEVVHQGTIGVRAELVVPHLRNNGAWYIRPPWERGEVVDRHSVTEVEALLGEPEHARDPHLMAALGHGTALVRKGLLRAGASIGCGQDVDDLHEAGPFIGVRARTSRESR